jgi:hypothetical protein
MRVQRCDSTGEQALTRVEYRAKNEGRVSDLASLANPFTGIEVFDPRKLPYSDPHRIAHGPLWGQEVTRSDIRLEAGSGRTDGFV